MEDIEDLYTDDMYGEDSPKSFKHPTENEKHKSQNRTKRYRGEVKGLKSPNVPKFLEWDAFNRPTGHWLKDYRQQIGKTVHTKVSILINTWEKVPQGLQDTLWDYIKTMYHIDDNPAKKKYVMTHLKDRFRDWKAKLVSGYITKTRKMSPDAEPPYVVYEAITEDIWKQFVAAKTTNEFKGETNH